jgi:Ino eighty subunit 2
MSDSGSDAEMEIDEVNQKLQEENDENEGEEEKLEPEDEEEEPELEPEQEDAPESEEASPPPSPPKQPRLKIKLKLPSVPSTEDTGSRGRSGDIDIESEDEDDEGEAVGSTRPMTSRQAVLASVVGSSHVSLSTGDSSRKKKQLTESELALRREETARKRRNLTEKKLEDEKAETINRLLKKQSKSKAKRSALSTAEASASEGEREVEQEEKEVILPTTWRWVSSTRPLVDPSTTSQEDAAQSKMRLTLGVPISVLSSTTPAPQPPLPKEKPQCDVPGCTEIRKYRLVRDWVRGACGLTHLKVLEVEAGTKMEVA